MAQIIDVLGKKRLTIGNEEYGRTIGIGADWGKLRLGVRYGIYPSAPTVSITTADLAIGLSEGTDLMYKNVSCRDFIGWSFGNPQGAATLTYGSPAPIFWTSSSPDGYYISRVAGVTTSISTASSPNILSADPYSYLGAQFIDITKNSPTHITVSIRKFTVQTIVTQEMFMKAMEDETNYGAIGTIVTSGNFTSYAGSSLWDSVDIAWNKSAPNQMDIAQISVTRFQ